MAPFRSQFDFKKGCERNAQGTANRAGEVASMETVASCTSCDGARQRAQLRNRWHTAKVCHVQNQNGEGDTRKNCTTTVGETSWIKEKTNNLMAVAHDGLAIRKVECKTVLKVGHGGSPRCLRHQEGRQQKEREACPVWPSESKSSTWSACKDNRGRTATASGIWCKLKQTVVWQPQTGR